MDVPTDPAPTTVSFEVGEVRRFRRWEKSWPKPIQVRLSLGHKRLQQLRSAAWRRELVVRFEAVEEGSATTVRCTPRAAGRSPGRPAGAAGRRPGRRRRSSRPPICSAIRPLRASSGARNAGLRTAYSRSSTAPTRSSLAPRLGGQEHASADSIRSSIDARVQRPRRRGRPRPLGGAASSRRGLPVQHGEAQLVLVGEVGVEGAPGELGPFADLLDAGAEHALLCEQGRPLRPSAFSRVWLRRAVSGGLAHRPFTSEFEYRSVLNTILYRTIVRGISGRQPRCPHSCTASAARATGCAAGC